MTTSDKTGKYHVPTDIERAREGRIIRELESVRECAEKLAHAISELCEGTDSLIVAIACACVGGASATNGMTEAQWVAISRAQYRKP